MGLKTRIVSLSLLAVAAWVCAVIAIGMGSVRKADRSEADEAVVVPVECR